MVHEDPGDVKERERRLGAAREKAKLEWRQAATKKAWHSVRASLEVFRVSGELLREDPRLTEQYKNDVVKGLRLDPVDWEEYAHLTEDDVRAIIELVHRNAAAFWVEGTPLTTVLYFMHDVIPTGPPCRLPPT